MTKLLTRNEFRSAVFERDGSKCVICSSPAVDAHHIIERRLWSDGGYYLSNGASLCQRCHLDAEGTHLSVEELRLACGISDIILPESFEPNQKYDKWGNQILSNGKRVRGILFHDSSVQRILSDVMNLFTPYVKYPRCFHLPWTDCKTSDDKILDNTSMFQGKEVVVTEKMDGENTSMYCDYIHPRSIEANHHPSQSWVKHFHSKMQSNIPEGWRVCGENLYAKHSIHYTNLPSYFMGFSIWDDGNGCLSWDQTHAWFAQLGVTIVPVMYEGVFDEELLVNLAKSLNKKDDIEGYVVRITDNFHFSKFKDCVAKYVKRDHITSDSHWRHKPIIKNKLASN